MNITNGIVYANEKSGSINVCCVEIVDELKMIITFSTGERKIFDATCLLEYPAFEALKNKEIFKTAKVEYGVVTWDNGKIDLAPETMYEKSSECEPIWIKRKR